MVWGDLGTAVPALFLDLVQGNFDSLENGHAWGREQVTCGLNSAHQNIIQPGSCLSLTLVPDTMRRSTSAGSWLLAAPVLGCEKILLLVSHLNMEECSRWSSWKWGWLKETSLFYQTCIEFLLSCSNMSVWILYPQWGWLDLSKAPTFVTQRYEVLVQTLLKSGDTWIALLFSLDQTLEQATYWAEALGFSSVLKVIDMNCDNDWFVGLVFGYSQSCLENCILYMTMDISAMSLTSRAAKPSGIY